MKARNDKENNGVTKLKPLNIKMPTNHPIFLYPDGERSKVARKWMDRGREVESVLHEVKKEIHALTKALVMDSETIQEVKTEGKKSKVNPDLFLGL